MERQTITVDIAPGNNQIQRLKSSQGDIGRPLGVYITQNGVALDCSAYTADLYILKPDGNYFTATATVDATEHNLITWETAKQETPMAGDCAAQIRILSNGDDVGTARFVEYVEASPGFVGESSESVVESLMEYVRQAAASAETASGAATSATGSASAASGSASAAASSASAAAGSASSAHTDAETASQAAQTAQDVADSIPEDYSTLSDDVTELKSALNVINDGGNIDFYKGDSKFYNGYYDASGVYQGNGSEANPPFSSWNVLLVHVIKNAKITIDGMPTESGTACVWLNSNSLTDVNSVAWGSSKSNGEKVCVTEWLALTGYQINPSLVNIVFRMYQDLLNSVDSVEEHFDSLESDAFNYTTQMLDATKKTSGKYYYPNNITKGYNAGMCLFPPIHLEAGKTYTLVNIRPVFTNFKVGNVIASVDGTDSGSTNKTMIFEPDSDGDLYVTGGDSANVMVFDADYAQNDYVFGKLNYIIKNKAIGNQITPDNCTFFKKCEQLLKSASASDGFWNINASGNAVKSSSTNAHAFEPFKLFAGVKYHFINMYGYFSLVANLDGSNALRVTDLQTNSWSGYYTPENDCYLFASVHNNYYGTTGMVLNDAQYVPNEYVEGVYYTYFIGNMENKVVDVHVKTDGTGDYTSVVDAVNFANAQKGNFPINIYIHTGDYDILEELGGDDFLATVDDSVDERQGLVLKADNINLIGVGLVTLRYELADNVTYNQSARTSCLNLREFSNRVENLVLIAKNCRYTIHDETNGGNPYIHRVMKNLRCIHKGNASGLWPYPTVMGGGAGGGSTYDLINCQFITSAYFQACSYHSGANQEASMFNIDGCVGSVKADAPTKISFRLSYHGTGRTGISVGNIKNCSGNGQTVVQPESSGDTDNNIEMYVNGWETIEPIAVTGNE